MITYAAMFKSTMIIIVIIINIIVIIWGFVYKH